MKSWTLEVQKLEDGDQYLEFPKELMEEVGWEEGDTLKRIDNGDGSWTLKKLDDTDISEHNSDDSSESR